MEVKEKTQSLFEELKKIIKNKNICICVYPNACGFLWSMSKVDSGTDLGYSGFTGDCPNSGSFLTYDAALKDAIHLLEKYDLELFRKLNPDSHWRTFAARVISFSNGA